ncbi:melanopsin-like [Amphiura filiformis]|uniref:melanopsin-like n=1 Tax=Amphiura filiformis TaxID=82378 RepID=UPI003B21C3C3
MQDALLDPGIGRNDTDVDPPLRDDIATVLTFQERIIVSTLTVLITTSGIIGNGIVIMCILLSSRLRTVCNAFVLNLCIADLITCLTGPIMVVAFLSTDGWKLPPVLCASVGFSTVTCIGCSVYTLTTIALNRLAIIRSSRGLYSSIYSPIKLAFIISLTWFVPLLIASLPPVFGIGRFGYDKRFSSCTWDPLHPLSRIYSLLLGVVFYPGPLLIILVCYSFIFCKIHKHSRTVVTSVEQVQLSVSKSSRCGETSVNSEVTEQVSQGLSQRQIEVTCNMFLVVIAFIVCFTPYGVSLMATESDEFIVYGAMILLSNSCINPIIYSIKHPEFKLVMRHVIKCRFNDIP